MSAVADRPARKPSKEQFSQVTVKFVAEGAEEFEDTVKRMKQLAQEMRSEIEATVKALREMRELVDEIEAESLDEQAGAVQTES